MDWSGTSLSSDSLLMCSSVMYEHMMDVVARSTAVLVLMCLLNYFVLCTNIALACNCNPFVNVLHVHCMSCDQIQSL